MAALNPLLFLETCHEYCAKTVEKCLDSSGISSAWLARSYGHSSPGSCTCLHHQKYGFRSAGSLYYRAGYPESGPLQPSDSLALYRLLTRWIKCSYWCAGDCKLKVDWGIKLISTIFEGGVISLSWSTKLIVHFSDFGFEVPFREEYVLVLTGSARRPDSALISQVHAFGSTLARPQFSVLKLSAVSTQL
jgi:hypothetical protein